MRLFGAILTVVFAVIATGAIAAPEKFILDKDHTYVGFDVSYLILARVSGRFDDFQGSFVINREHPEKNRADIIIKTGSVNTGIKTRDEDIRGPGLFNANRHPTMVFHSQKIELGPDNTGVMNGDLTLLGITKPVTMDIFRIPDPKFKGSGKDESFAGGFKATGKIKRSDFGMNAYIRPIGNTVTLYVCYNMIECGGEDTDQKKIKPRYND
jgi:polyisoprenoid-binding protein YceI